MLNFIAKFAAIGFAVVIVGAMLGLDGASAADRTSASSAEWVRMKTDHGVVRLRSGAGGRLFRRRTLPTV